MKRISPVRGGDAAVACPWPWPGGSGHSCRGRLWIRRDFLAASPCAVLERSEGSRGLWTGCVSRSHQAGPREDQGKRELAFLFWGGGGGKSPPASTMAPPCSALPPPTSTATSLASRLCPSYWGPCFPSRPSPAIVHPLWPECNFIKRTQPLQVLP